MSHNTLDLEVGWEEALRVEKEKVNVDGLEPQPAISQDGRKSPNETNMKVSKWGSSMDKP